MSLWGCCHVTLADLQQEIQQQVQLSGTSGDHIWVKLVPAGHQPPAAPAAAAAAAAVDTIEVAGQQQEPQHEEDSPTAAAAAAAAAAGAVGVLFLESLSPVPQNHLAAAAEVICAVGPVKCGGTSSRGWPL